MLEASKRRLSLEELNCLATDLASEYDFQRLLGEFEWDNEKMPAALETRQKLSRHDPINDSRSALNYAQIIHQWGFGRSISNSVLLHVDFEPRLYQMVREWQSAKNVFNSTEASHTLKALLEVPGLGLATVTKWICFLDQGRFAIYDSRVSYAIRSLKLDASGRVFPLIASRTSHRRRGEVVRGDACVGNADRAVNTYFNFLDLLDRTTQILNARAATKEWTASTLECCLFAAGKSRLKTTPKELDGN